MPIVRLSPAFVRNANCPPTDIKIDYFDTTMRGFMLEVRASGGKTYYQRYTDERGRERQFKIGPADVLTLRQARRKAKQTKAAAILGNDPQMEREERRAVPTLKVFVHEQYLPYVRTYKRSWKTDETVLRVHILPKLGRLHLDEVTTDAIGQVVAAMRREDYAPGTVGRVIVILRFMFNLARKWKTLTGSENPASGLPVPPDVQRNRFLNATEIARLIEVLSTDKNQVAANAIFLLLLTGARRNEITHAQWEHVDLDDGRLLVPVAKSGKPRYIVLNSDATELLRSIPRRANCPYVFASPITGRPCASLHFPWQRIRIKAGIPDVRLHDLRHTFASVLINKRVHLYDVQLLLGHANAKTTQRYAHLTPATLGKAAEVMSSVIGAITSELKSRPK
jgi:integrase